MAAVRSLRMSVKPDSGSERSQTDSDSDRDTREAEPMEVEEVEEGELEADVVSVNRSLKELLPDTSRRYENKAGAFITGIDVNSKEVMERKEKRARRFHLHGEEAAPQRNVFLDKDSIRKAIPRLRLEAIHVTGVDDMSTQDVFGYFKEYPPAHIEWIDDTSCNVVWLDDDTSVRALTNTSRMPDLDTIATETDEVAVEQSKARRGRGSDEEEEGEVDDDDSKAAKKSDDKEADGQVSTVSSTRRSSDTAMTRHSAADAFQLDEPPLAERCSLVRNEPPLAERCSLVRNELSLAETCSLVRNELSLDERSSLLRNDLRAAIKPFRGNKLFLRFATQDDKKEPGAARRSRYYMKYGNPNYGGMKGILSNSWKRRYHNRRIQRDVIKSKKPLIGDSMGHTPPYTHQHSADLVDLPEEPIKEEEEDDDDNDENMEEDDRVVEYRERSSRSLGAALRSRTERSPSPWSESDEMDYDLELKMISTPSPKKSKKMTMYADEVETRLKSIRDRVGTSGPQVQAKALSPPKVTDVRQLLEEKRQGLSQHRQPPSVAGNEKTDVRQRLGKRRYSPDRCRSPSPDSPRDTLPTREPVRDVHRRLGVASQDSRGTYANLSKDTKPGGLWSRLGSGDDGSSGHHDHRLSGRSAGLYSSSTSSTSLSAAGQKDGSRKSRDEEEEEEEEEEDDSTLQRMWGAMIKQKQERLSHKMKKSRLDNLPSLQIEISRESSEDSDA